MKVTQKQEDEFRAARNKFLDEIYTFRSGVEYAEKVTGQEINRKYWIEELEKKVKELKVEELRILNGPQYGYTIGNYQKSIEEVFLIEFSHIIPAFMISVTRYQAEINRIFM